MASDVLFEVKNGVGFVTFNRPEARNALTFGMYDRLAEIFDGISIGGDVRSVILSGADQKSFAAGTDMKQFRAFSNAQDALDYETRMEEVLEILERCPVPTIAAISGACTGAGAAIAAACDIRICDENLKFGFPIARTLGNCLSVRNMNRLVALVGYGIVKEMTICARLLGHREALQHGLVSEVHSTASGVSDRALELAMELSTNAPLTMKAAKETLRRLRDLGPEADDSDLISECYTSADFKMAIEAFFLKEKPKWTGT